MRTQDSSARTSAAPSASAFSFANAKSRGRYFMPQSGAGDQPFGRNVLQGRANAIRHHRRRFGRGIGQIDHAEHDLSSAQGPSSTPRSSFGCAASMEIWSRRAFGELGQERVADRLLAGDDGGVAEAQMHDGGRRDAVERAVDRLDRDALRRGRDPAQPRLIELDDVGARPFRDRAPPRSPRRRSPCTISSLSRSAR